MSLPAAGYLSCGQNTIALQETSLNANNSPETLCLASHFATIQRIIPSLTCYHEVRSYFHACSQQQPPLATPLSERQATSSDESGALRLDPTILGQKWLDMVKTFSDADGKVTADEQQALIKSISSCSVGATRSAFFGETELEFSPLCDFDPAASKLPIAIEAKGLGQQWLNTVQKFAAAGRVQNASTKQKLVDDISRCRVLRRSAQLPGQSDSFSIDCPTVSGN